MYEMMSANKFKETILTRGYNPKKEYKLKIQYFKDGYFNNIDRFLELANNALDNEYSLDDKKARDEWKKSGEHIEQNYIRDFATYLYIAYNKDMAVFMDGKNGRLVYDVHSITPFLNLSNSLLLIEEFSRDIPNEVDPNDGGEYDASNDLFCFTKLCNHAFKLDREAFKNIINDHILQKIIERIYDETDDEEYNEFFDFLLDNFDIRNYIEESGYTDVEKSLLQKVIDKDQSLREKDEYNMDILLRFAFVKKYEEVVEFLCDKLSYISTDKIDEDAVNLIVFQKHGIWDIEKYVPLKIIRILSSLENFDDFVQNNFNFLMKILDEEALEFIRRYIDIQHEYPPSSRKRRTFRNDDGIVFVREYDEDRNSTSSREIEYYDEDEIESDDSNEEIMTLNEFKETILLDGFDPYRNYKVTNGELDNDYFNENTELVSSIDEYLEGEDSEISEHMIRTIAFLLYLSYDINVEDFLDRVYKKHANSMDSGDDNLSVFYNIGYFVDTISEENCRLLIEEFGTEHFNEFSHNTCYIELFLRLFKLGADFDDLIDSSTLTSIFKEVQGSENEDEDEFLDYVIDYCIENLDEEFDIEELIFENCRYYYGTVYFARKLADRGIQFQHKIDCNMDALLYCALYLNDEKTVKYITDRVSSISTDKIDEGITTGRYDKNKYISLEIMQYLSSLENFEDFVKNNVNILTNILDEDAKQFIENYL